MSVKKESTLLEDLNQALAGETLAAFRYLYLSKIANGINSAHLSSIFQEIAKEEWAHASTLMGRIIQLGGVPLARPAEWEKRSFLPYYEPPRRGNDLKALIKDSLKLERASIDFFQKLALKTRDSDMITYAMAMNVMAEETRDEERISSASGVVGPLAPSATSFALILAAFFSVITSSRAAGTRMSTSSSSSSSFVMGSLSGMLTMLPVFFL